MADSTDDAGFSLAEVAREVLGSSESEDPEQILKEITGRVPAAALGEAFAQALPAFVRHLRGPKRPGAALTGSAKVAGIREMWRRYLEGRYAVEDGSLRRLGDFSHDDLLYVSAALDARAQTLMMRAGELRTLAAAVAEHDVARVRDLPDAVLASVLGRAAA